MRAFRGGILAILGVILVGLVITVQLRPSVPRAIPDARTASLARDSVASLRQLLVDEAPTGRIDLSLAEIDALLVSLERVRPGLRADADIVDGDLRLRASIGAPLLPLPVWLNPRIVIGPSEDGLAIKAASLGSLPIPVSVARRGLGLALDRLLGPGSGEMVLAGIAGLNLEGNRARLRYALGEADGALLFARLKERVHAFAGGGDAERIKARIWDLHYGGHIGALPREGTLLPQLRMTLARAEGADGMKPALIALMLYCGDTDLAEAFGVFLDTGFRDPRNYCRGITLGGRDDLKRHFAVSAGIRAAKSGEVVFGIGEFKELLDSNAGGSGFSFDDMAADLAGARFAQVLLETPPEARAALAGRIMTEADVLPPLDGLPSGLPEAEFRARFGDVNSPAYRAMIAEIDRRLDAMPLYAGTSADG